MPQGLIFSSIGSWLRSGPYHDEEIDLELDDRDRDAGDDGRSFPMHSVPTVDGLGFGPDAGNGHDSRLSEMVEDYRRSRAAESASAPGPASCSPRGRETREQQPLAYGAMGQELLSLMVLLQRQLKEQGRMDADMTFDASSWKIKLLRLLVIPQSCPGQAHQAARTCDSDCDLLRLLWCVIIPRIAPGPKLCPNVASINPTQHNH